MSGQLPMFDRTTSEGSGSVTSSLGLADGATRLGLPDGPTIAKSGPEVVHANHSRARGKATRPPIRVIFGQRGSGSLASAHLQRSLVSRLRVLTDGRGSTLFAMTWRERTTPSGRVLPQLVASVHRSQGRAFTSWQRPLASEYRQKGYQYDQGNKLKPRLSTYGLIFGAPGVGIDVPMDAHGKLNPDLLRWLMGYPASWALCVATVMRSVRPKRKSSSKPTVTPEASK